MNTIIDKIRNDFKFSEVTGYLILVNIIIFIITLMNSGFVYSNFAIYYPMSDEFKWFQPFTHMFIHGGFLHLAMNMYGVWVFGKGMERMWGGKKFLTFYLLSGFGSVLLSSLSSSSFPAVGASGALYGVIVGYVAMNPNQRLSILFLPWSFKASNLVFISIGIEVLLGLSGLNTGIGHWAHVGGALTGFLLFVFWLKGRKIKQVERFIPRAEDYIESKALANYILGYDKDIAFDKEAYIRTYHQRTILIDTSIYTKFGNLIWQGDLDISVSEEKIKEIALKLNTVIYISKSVNYKKEYIFKTSGKSLDYQIDILEEYRNKL